MHQRDVGPNSHREEQDGISAKRRDRERPEGSNARSRQERQDTSHPSVVDTAPLHMVAEIQMMKERKDFMMNALRGWVSNDLDKLVHRMDSPFTAPITSFPLPRKFRMPQIEAYDGFKDPLDHLESFKTLMHLQGVADKIMCRASLTMLKDPARVWFSRLMPNSISTFKELNAQFASHFIGGHWYKKFTACLMSIKQQKDETLKSYITRFNKEALSTNEANDKILAIAFTNGLQNRKFFSLYTKRTQRPCQMCFIEPPST